MKLSTKAILISSFISTAIILGLISWHLTKLSATLNITAVPLESKITVNGQKAKQGLNKTEPGKKTITVVMLGFKPVSQTVTISVKEQRDVNIVLTSNSTQTANWYLTHPKDETAAEGISSRANDELAMQSIQQTPLIQLLPFVSGGLEFRVDYGNLPNVNQGLPLIYITAPTRKAQQDGLDWIKSLGYDLKDYKIKTVTGEVQGLNQ